MKKIFTLMMTIAIIMFAGSSWAGPNFFSSDNEQYGLMASTYVQVAILYNNDANAAYTNYMLAYYSGDDDTADEMYDLYEDAYEEASDAAELALKCYEKMSITVPAVSSLNLDDPTVMPLMKFKFKRKEKFE